MDGKIHLRLKEFEDGVRKVVDQDGREVFGIVNTLLKLEAGGANILQIDLYESTKGCRVNLNRKPQTKAEP